MSFGAARRGRQFVAVMTIALLAACGGGGGSSPTPPVTQPPPPATTTISTGTFVGLNPGFLRIFDFASPRSGSLVAAASWTFGNNDVDIYIVSGNTCTTTNAIGTPTGAGCTILCQDIRVGGNTATCTAAVTAGNARLFVVNLGPGGESGTYTITIT